MQQTARIYYTYILTDKFKRVYYTGVTNNLKERLLEHYLQRGNPSSFTGLHHSYYLLFYEMHKYIDQAIRREKIIKKMSRERKEKLIDIINPQREFLNGRFWNEWPPTSSPDLGLGRVSRRARMRGDKDDG